MFAQHDVENYEDEKEGVIRTDDVRRCMKCVYLDRLPDHGPRR